MGAKFANNAFGVLALGIGTSSTVITLNSGEGNRFPTLGAGEYFYATLVSPTGYLEIVKCTSRIGDSLTVVRAQDGTVANSFGVGDRLELRIVAAVLEQYLQQDDLDPYAQKADYATASIGGTVKLRLDGTNLYMTTNGDNA